MKKKTCLLAKVVTIEADAPEKDTPMSRLMQLQGQLKKYIKLENGKVSLTIKVD